MAEIVKLLLAVFAVYRLSYLISSEEGPYLGWPKSSYGIGIFESLRERLSKRVYDADGNEHIVNNIGRGVNCPLCVGAYVTIFVLLLLQLSFTATNMFIFWLGIWGIQTFLERLSSSD